MSDWAIAALYLDPKGMARAKAKADRSAARNTPERVLERRIKSLKRNLADKEAWIAEPDTQQEEIDRWTPFIATLRAELAELEG